MFLSLHSSKRKRSSDNSFPIDEDEQEYDTTTEPEEMADRNPQLEGPLPNIRRLPTPTSTWQV